jgi:hypothetical protein
VLLDVDPVGAAEAVLDMELAVAWARQEIAV